MYVDLDNFKAVNDSMGHDAGDELLVEVAATIQSAVRGTDTVGRPGGDEFAVLLPETDQEHGKWLSRKCKPAARERCRENNWPVPSALA